MRRPPFPIDLLLAHPPLQAFSALLSVHGYAHMQTSSLCIVGFITRGESLAIYRSEAMRPPDHALGRKGTFQL